MVTNSYFPYVRRSIDRDSPTYAAATEGKALKAKHKDAILLSLGELDISPSEADLDAWRAEAGRRAAAGEKDYQLAEAKGKGRQYPLDIGTPEFRAVAAKLFSRENGIGEVTADNIVVSMGGKGVLNGLGSSFQPGDKVLLAGPGWPTNYDIWRDGVEMIELNTEGRGLMSAAQLKQAFIDHPDIKAVLINDPCNPTGARYTPQEREDVMHEINEARARNTNLVAIVDDPYGALTYGGATMKRGPEETMLFNAGGEVVVNSVSKVYASPDMRVGYAVSKNDRMLKAVSLFNKNKGCSVANKMQNDAQLLLLFGEPFKEETKARLEKRAQLLADEVANIGLSMQKPQGAIYGWIDCSSLKGRSYTGPDGAQVNIEKPADVARFMRDMAHVAPVDGGPFYAPESPAADQSGWFVRVVLTAEETLKKACGQIGGAMGKLQGKWAGREEGGGMSARAAAL